MYVLKKDWDGIPVSLTNISYLTFKKKSGTVALLPSDELMTLYPNPVNGPEIQIMYQSHSFGLWDILIVDSQGMPVRKMSHFPTIGNNIVTMYIDHLPIGLYTCTITFLGKTMDSKRFIKH